MAASKSFAFVFPMASGHINPSLPLARRLVQLGHEVHYLCRPQMREAIEDTGAVFHCEIENEPEMYLGRTPSMFGALDDVKKEYGLEEECWISASIKLREVLLEMLIPGVLRWLKRVDACAVVYCPMMSSEATFAAKVLGIPSVALLTTAGPGSMPKSIDEIFRVQGIDVEGLIEARRSFPPLQASVERLRAQYGIVFSAESVLRPLGRCDGLLESSLTLTTTCESLQDPCPEELAEVYRSAGVRFEAVGPLLDVQGARRAAGHKLEGEVAASVGDTVDMLALLKEAKAAGRKVVMVSMGTVITGDSPDFGWEARLQMPDGTRRGLTGRQLCRAAWAGAFHALGSDDESAPLMLVALGPQCDALGELVPPANAVCLPVVPQVDLLKAGVDAFLTHGGQNSFTEALASGVPVVVCPGFADQPVNGRKAQEMGVGLQVPRPMPDDGEEEAAAEEYSVEVAASMKRVLGEACFREAAGCCAEELRAAGGVPRAVELVLDLAIGRKAKAAPVARAGA